MAHRPVFLIDETSARVAALDVQFQDDRFEGTIRLDGAPPELRRLFEDFEEIVEGQILSLLDDIEAKIEDVRLRVIFDNGAEAKVADLQVYPSSRAVSFKTLEATTAR